MDRFGKGIVAGFLATLALSLLLDPISILVGAVGVASPMIGWLTHLFVGTVIWGPIFAIVHDHISGPSWLRGLVFGIAAWLLVMLVIMPLSGAGLFAIGLGIATPSVTFIVHALYGALLGEIYGRLLSPEEEHAASTHESKHLRPMAW
jgi:hypothetical protein